LDANLMAGFSPAILRQKMMAPVELDAYLMQIAQRHETHRFLGGATQGLYVRMVDFLASQFLKPGKKIKVLDWGCGKGHISYLLKQRGFNVVSCDIQSSDPDSAFAQATPILSEQSIPVVALTHPSALPFADGEFDLVVSFGVLEHVHDDQASLQEIRRILKPGGVFFFSFLPYWLSWTQRLAHLRGNYYHPILYRKSRIAEMAKQSTMSLIYITHGQLLPKNSLGNSAALEKFDRILTHWTPLKHFATNLEGFMVAT
jgi:SAM-dependent methyltransferase